LLYIPCAAAMFIERAKGCYKVRQNISFHLMLWLSLVDMTALAILGISHGILFLQGAVYCTAPIYNFVTGCITMGTWCGASIGSLMLGVNRICAFLGVARWLQHSTWLLIGVSTVYTSYFSLFTPPVKIFIEFKVTEIHSIINSSHFI
ncbi:hypothetical protein PFISCL1PPCAC_14207, partial [Pristionchus fissidentatus]